MSYTSVLDDEAVVWGVWTAKSDVAQCKDWTATLVNDVGVKKCYFWMGGDWKFDMIKDYIRRRLQG